MITLKTLDDATDQEIFDQVAKHLLKQGRKCCMRGCSYIPLYHYDSLKCAAGCLIADDEYEDAMEFLTWQSVVDQFRLPFKHVKLITRLQSVHDDTPVETWKAGLLGVSGEFGLKFDPEDFVDNRAAFGKE